MKKPSQEEIVQSLRTELASRLDPARPIPDVLNSFLECVASSISEVYEQIARLELMYTAPVMKLNRETGDISPLTPTGRYQPLDWRKELARPWPSPARGDYFDIPQVASDSADALSYALMSPEAAAGRAKRHKDFIRKTYSVEEKAAAEAMDAWSMSVTAVPTVAMATPSRVLDHTRTSKAVGEYKDPPPAAGRMMSCKKSEWHGFHPANVPCPYCEPPKPVAAPAPEVGDWYVDIATGDVVNADFSWSWVRQSPMYTPLSTVKAGSVLSKRMCGCHRPGGTCRTFAKYSGQVTVHVHYQPNVIKNSEWQEV